MKTLTVFLLMLPVFCQAQQSGKAPVDSTSAEKSPIILRGVVVKANTITRTADRFVVQVSPSENKNGEELLQQAPGVTLSDKDISIYGSGGTKIMVNDREIRLTGEALIAYLRSLSSADIQRIEVQPMSDASQDADAQSGFIHIILRKYRDKGIHGNLSLDNHFYKSLQNYQPSLSLYTHNRKWDTYASTSGTIRPTDGGWESSDRIYTQPGRQFNSYSRLKSPLYYGTIRLGAVYSIDTLNTVGAEVEYIHNYDNIKTADQSSISNEDATSLLKSDGTYRQKSIYDMYSATANYQHRIDNKGSIFKIIADYVKKCSTGNNLYNIYQQWNSNDTTYRSHIRSIYSIASADVSLKKCLSKKTSYQVGIKYTTTNMNDNSHYDGLHGNTWDNMPDYAYLLKYEEDIAGGYMSFSTELGNWSVSAGLRYEHTRTSDHTNHFTNKYGDIYPHLSINYAFDQLHKWMLAYQLSRNIERPPFDALNPNRMQLSEYSYMIGNPLLKPTYIDKTSLTLIYDYRYTLTIGGNLHHNLIREVCMQDTTNANVSYITYGNHYRENHWFVNVNTPLQPFTWLNWTTNLTYVRQCIKYTKQSNYSNHNLLFVNSTATFLLPSDYSAELYYNAYNRLYSGNSEVEPYQTLNLTMKKKWGNGRWAVSAGVDNIFNEKNKYASRLDAYTTNSKYDLASNGRIIKFAVTWSFNSGKKFKSTQLENSSSSERERFNPKEQ